MRRNVFEDCGGTDGSDGGAMGRRSGRRRGRRARGRWQSPRHRIRGFAALFDLGFGHERGVALAPGDDALELLGRRIGASYGDLR